MELAPPPWSTHLELPFEATAVRIARTHARDAAQRWLVPEEISEAVVLIVSELVTNALRYAKGPRQTCELTMRYAPTSLLVCVHDEDRTPPVLLPLTSQATSGRGLHLVEKLSQAWGYSHQTPTCGKTVYAQLALPDPRRQIGAGTRVWARSAGPFGAAPGSRTAPGGTA